MTLYDKVLRVFAMLQSSIRGKADMTNFAAAFNEERSYDVGRLCVRDNKLYRCTANHHGAWNADHFTQTTVDGALAIKANATDTPWYDSLYIKDGSTGMYHKVLIEKSGGVSTLAVDQDEETKQ